MQNIPDKGVRGPPYYLTAEYLVTGLSGSLLGSQGKNGEGVAGVPFWGSKRPLLLIRTNQIEESNLGCFCLTCRSRMITLQARFSEGETKPLE
jgi:hypothetical protein